MSDAATTLASQPTAREIREREQHYFADALQSFIRRYGDELRGQDRADFEHETYYLIQRAQSLAQQPLLDQLTILMRAMPMPSFLVGADPASGPQIPAGGMKP